MPGRFDQRTMNLSIGEKKFHSENSPGKDSAGHVRNCLLRIRKLVFLHSRAEDDTRIKTYSVPLDLYGRALSGADFTFPGNSSECDEKGRIRKMRHITTFIR